VVKPTDEELETAVRAWFAADGKPRVAGDNRDSAVAREWWNAIAPLVLERAAKECDASAGRLHANETPGFAHIAEAIAERIRALKDTP
jgi:hypothetical protein